MLAWDRDDHGFRDRDDFFVSRNLENVFFPFFTTFGTFPINNCGCGFKRGEQVIL
jgi:hypothetical protein